MIIEDDNRPIYDTHMDGMIRATIGNKMGFEPESVPDSLVAQYYNLTDEFFKENLNAGE